MRRLADLEGLEGRDFVTEFFARNSGLPDDDREVMIVLEDGRVGVVTLGTIRRAIDKSMPAMARAICDNAPMFKLLIQRGKRK
jgi:hypothetical protein